ncbi:MAG: MOSC domain-containing protein [Gemmatimonadales bacterium]
MRVESIQTGQARSITPEAGEPWTSAIWKEPVQGGVWVGTEGLAGDVQANRRVHGGPERAVLLYPMAHYPVWRAEWGDRTVGPGAFGENLTVSGLDETTVCVGDVFQIGEIRIEVSGPRQPCLTLERRHGRPGLVDRVLATARGGWYARVGNEGWLEAGATLELLDRPYPQWPIARALAVRMDRSRADEGALLGSCPALLADWREKLRPARTPAR